MINLDDYQLDAIKKLKSGSVLCGGVGSGKSITAIAYYFFQNGGAIDDGELVPMDDPPKDLYIITTALKRDKFEWDSELIRFLLNTKSELNLYSNKVVVDSWNNIKKYVDVKNAFFIFDEQRVVGSGVWVRSFLKIVKANEWILLTATPGDTWSDYIPVFIANGFYRNRSEFLEEHAIFMRGVKYPKIMRYVGIKKLEGFRNQILVEMAYEKPTESHWENVVVDYDQILYKDIFRTRWNPFTNKPTKNAAELCYVLREVVNKDPDRINQLIRICFLHERIIIFYNFNYELDILREFAKELGRPVAEWNGHKHEPIPETDKWLYLVQYNSGAEGWNCTKTNAMIFFSQHYSYKIMHQAAGRIDRRNTPYKELYYYIFKSKSSIDRSIALALKNKKTFNENRFLEKKFRN